MQEKIIEKTQTLQSLFSLQKGYIDYFFAHVDLAAAEKILHAMLNCKGIIAFSGVGKSAIVAEKLARTLVSIGIKSIFIHPVDALHGDIGALSDQDIMILISKSGATSELLRLFPALRAKQVSILSWVSKENSPLYKKADLSIVLPLQSELCPYDLSPTTSPSIQMIFGDILTIALMQETHFSLEAYALNHPAGAIGNQLIYKVYDLMLKESQLPLCHEDDSLKDVIFELTNKKCGCVLVVDQKQQLKGIFTDGDLRRNLQKYSNVIFDKTMKEMMTSSFLSISPHQLAADAMALMQKNPQRRVMMLPVIDRDNLVGLITMHDIIQAGLK